MRGSEASFAEPSPVAGTCSTKESVMANEPKKQEPDIPPRKPDIQPEPTPQEIPQDKNFPEKESPPMQLLGTCLTVGAAALWGKAPARSDPEWNCEANDGGPAKRFVLSSCTPAH
jgi:hypothetical protein